MFARKKKLLYLLRQNDICALVSCVCDLMSSNLQNLSHRKFPRYHLSCPTNMRTFFRTWCKWSGLVYLCRPVRVQDQTCLLTTRSKSCCSLVCPCHSVCVQDQTSLLMTRSTTAVAKFAAGRSLCIGRLRQRRTTTTVCGSCCRLCCCTLRFGLGFCLPFGFGLRPRFCLCFGIRLRLRLSSLWNFVGLCIGILWEPAPPCRIDRFIDGVCRGPISSIHCRGAPAVPLPGVGAGSSHSSVGRACAGACPICKHVLKGFPGKNFALRNHQKSSSKCLRAQRDLAAAVNDRWAAVQHSYDCPGPAKRSSSWRG